MLVEFRPHARLRGKRPADLGASVLPVVAAVSESDLDLGTVRVVCDWVQYRDNFRDVVALRPILHDEIAPASGVRQDLEIAVDVRRAGDLPVGALTAALLHGPGDRVLIEDWGPGRDSCVWQFNALYWSALDLWEKATGRGYEQALPGGESAARNRAAAAELIGELFAVWDRLAASAALPDELYVIELGVGNGNQAKVFLDEFRDLDRERGTGYYRRLRYLMCDYSAHVLDLARQTVAEHTERVSSFALDATRPRTSLGFLRYKAFLVYIANVYDNLPTDEVAQLGGHTYRVHTRAYLPGEAAAELAASVGARVEELPGLVHKLLRLGPALLAEACPGHVPDTEAAVRFWQHTWAALRLEERYVPLAGLDTYPLTDTLTGEALRPLLESGADVRMHVSNGAVASFDDTLTLLHPFGKLVCHDIFVDGVEGYRTTFRGPGKYDGSVVNWVNGALLAHIGRKRGFDVDYTPFRHRAGGHVVTMTAQVRD
ncbi:hypothetical protein [Actinophytocola sediminis]